MIIPQSLSQTFTLFRFFVPLGSIVSKIPFAQKRAEVSLQPNNLQVGQRKFNFGTGAALAANNNLENSEQIRIQTSTKVKVFDLDNNFGVTMKS